MATVIPIDDFLPLVCSAVPRFHDRAPNEQQLACIRHDPNQALMIVAGPGSGKTTVLVLRALRLVFVDGLMPEQVVLTTFTRKAADELRARLIEWGRHIKDYLALHPPQRADVEHRLDSIDINRFVTGTLDSLCEDILTTLRDPADAVPVLVEGFVGDGILIRSSLFPNRAHINDCLARYLSAFTLDGSAPANFGKKVEICRTFLDRFIHDLVDLTQFREAHPHTEARQLIATCADAYRQSMASAHRLDFALLEEAFLLRLEQERLQRLTNNLRALLVDEYQDTNPLQERIYFTLVRQANCSFTIVGDDDQSLYRFRGATVELFRDFEERFVSCLPEQARPTKQYLFQNYRSTPEIVSFFNSFARSCPDFQSARVQPPKPLILARRSANGVPVLGMFRSTAASLASDLTGFLWDVFRGTGRTVGTTGSQATIIRAQGGDFGDGVLLSHTVNEFASSFRNQPPRVRLPQLLRRELAQRGVDVFNPRGRLLRDIPVVQQFLGTLLNCIDGNSALQAAMGRVLRSEAIRYLDAWRHEALDFAATNPPPATPHTLSDFVQSWQNRSVQGSNMDWPREWPVLELAFKLMCWFPFLRDDPEGQVYLEAVSRCIAGAANYSPYRSIIYRGQAQHDNQSVIAAIRDIFAPIAESSIEVDEEIMTHVPRSRFPIMTIHQAKGLEFPLVIVDVASDYLTNNRLTRPRRFPDSPSSVQRIEDDIAPFSQVGPLRQARTSLQRSFDDLIRLYYVAYSRPECVLMLVGVDPCLRYQTTVRHVATGWASDGSWAWRTPVEGPLPAIVNNHPLLLI